MNESLIDIFYTRPLLVLRPILHTWIYAYELWVLLTSEHWSIWRLEGWKCKASVEHAVQHTS